MLLSLLGLSDVITFIIVNMQGRLDEDLLYMVF